MPKVTKHKSKAKNKNKSDALSSILLLLSLGISVYVIFRIARDINRIQIFIDSVGAWGPLVSVLMFGILSLTPISSDPMMLINGALFGPIFGGFLNWMGNNLASLLEYSIGNQLGNIADFEKKKEKLPFGLSKLPVDSSAFLFFGRFIPQFGGKIVSLSAGIYKVPFKKYLWTTAIANLLGSLLVAFGGHLLRSIL